MAMRAATAALTAPRGGFLRMFSTNSTLSSSFPFPQTTQQTNAREQAEPNTNLFVSGLSKRTMSEGLREAFAKFGEVIHARVVTDRASGYSKGFGFVRYATLEDAAEGIKGMDGQFLDGWVIFAEYARPRGPPSEPQRTTWIQDMETTQVLLTAGRESLYSREHVLSLLKLAKALLTTDQSNHLPYASRLEE